MSHLHTLQHGMGREQIKKIILADSPTAYWICDESTGSTFVDSSGNGYDLTKTANVVLREDALYPVPDGTRYPRYPQTLTTGASRAGTLGASVPMIGNWTWESIVRCYAVPSATITEIFTIKGNGETEATNAQIVIYLSSSGISALWETGAGTDIAIVPTAQFSPQAGYPSHYMVTKSGLDVTFFMNGRKLETVTASGQPTGGTGTVGVVICSDGTYALGPTNSGIVMGHIAFYNGTVLTEEKARARAWACGLWGTSI